MLNLITPCKDINHIWSAHKVFSVFTVWTVDLFFISFFIDTFFLTFSICPFYHCLFLAFLHVLFTIAVKRTKKV